MKGRQERRDQIFELFAPPPTLTPPVRTEPYPSYVAIEAQQKRNYNAMVDNLLQTGEIHTLDHQQYFEMMTILRERRRQLSNQNPHTPAQIIDDAMKTLSNLFLEKHLYETKAEHVEAVQIQLQILRDKLVTVQNNWDNKIQNLKQKQEADLQKIQSNFTQNLTKYDNSIPNQLPARYCKLSSELLNLIDMEKHLIIAHRFLEADKLHQEIQAKQAIELKEKKAVYAKSFEIGRKGVEMQNKRKLDAALVKWDHKVKLMKDRAHKEIEALKAAISNIEHKLADIQSEYIGENDPIVLENEIRQFPASRNLNPRPIRKSVKQQTNEIRCSNRRLNSRRWP